jgi:hypothetical protein
VCATCLTQLLAFVILIILDEEFEA